jgi:hypothetical protein
MLRICKVRKAIIISILFLLAFSFSENIWASNQSQLKVSAPELAWAMAHPFIAIKAKSITKRAMIVTDSIERVGILKDRSGGQLDAFKHAFWMALLSQRFKSKKVYKLGLTHEKYNYRQSKKGKGGGDQIASNMDLWNNKVGIDIGYVHRNISEDSLITVVINAIKRGAMRIIKKNSNGDSLDKQGRLIDNSTLKTWMNNRCLVSSDYKYN